MRNLKLAFRTLARTPFVTLVAILSLALGLGAIDPEVPDGRPMIVADDPYFAIHRWDGGQLVSHLDTAADHQVLAHYTPKLQPLVRMLISEKEGSTLLDLG